MQRVKAISQPYGMISNNELKRVFRSVLKEEYDLKTVSLDEKKMYNAATLYQSYLAMTPDHRRMFKDTLSDKSIPVFKKMESEYGNVKFPTDGNVYRYGRAVEDKIKNEQLRAIMLSNNFTDLDKVRQRQYINDSYNHFYVDNNGVKQRAVNMADYVNALDVIELQYDKANIKIDKEEKRDIEGILLKG